MIINLTLENVCLSVVTTGRSRAERVEIVAKLAVTPPGRFNFSPLENYGSTSRKIYRFGNIYKLYLNYLKFNNKLLLFSLNLRWQVASFWQVPQRIFCGLIEKRQQNEIDKIVKSDQFIISWQWGPDVFKNLKNFRKNPFIRYTRWNIAL